MQSWTLFAEFSDRIVCYVLQRICFHKPRSQIEDSYVTNISGSASKERKEFRPMFQPIEKNYINPSSREKCNYILLYDAKPIIFALVYLPVTRVNLRSIRSTKYSDGRSDKVCWANHTNSEIMLIDICKYPAFV